MEGDTCKHTIKVLLRITSDSQSGLIYKEAVAQSVTDWENIFATILFIPRNTDISSYVIEAVFPRAKDLVGANLEKWYDNTINRVDFTVSVYTYGMKGTRTGMFRRNNDNTVIYEEKNNENQVSF